MAKSLTYRLTHGLGPECEVRTQLGPQQSVHHKVSNPPSPFKPHLLASNHNSPVPSCPPPPALLRKDWMEWLDEEEEARRQAWGDKPPPIITDEEAKVLRRGRGHKRDDQWPGRRRLKQQRGVHLVRDRAARVQSVGVDAAWLEEWHARVSCWWMALPMPTQAQLGECMGALALALGSRLDSSLLAAQALIGRSTSGSAGGGGGGAPTAPAAEPGCEWVLMGEQISHPEMPTSFPPNLDFTLPPIPKLLPSWQQLQSLAEERRAEERRAEQQRAEQHRAEQQRAEQQRAVAVMEGLASTHTHLPLKMAHLPWEISQLPMEVAPLLRLEPTRVPQGPARMHNSAPPAMLGGIAGFGLASAVVLGLVSSRRSGHRAKLRASSLRS